MIIIKRLIFSILFLRSSLHYSLHTLYDIIYIGEIPFAIAIVKYLNLFTFSLMRH